MAELFRVLGMAAGLAGLGIGLFIVVVRLVLQHIPKDKLSKLPGSTYLQLLNRIMIYAFVIALLSLCLWAGLEFLRTKA